MAKSSTALIRKTATTPKAARKAGSHGASTTAGRKAAPVISGTAASGAPAGRPGRTACRGSPQRFRPAGKRTHRGANVSVSARRAAAARVSVKGVTVAKIRARGGH